MRKLNRISRWPLALALFVSTAAASQAGEILYQFSGTATALDGSSVNQSFEFLIDSLVTLDTTRQPDQLAACSITGDSCSYVSLFSAGPGDPNGHPELEIGGLNGAYDYYFDYGAFAATGTYSTIDLGTGTSGRLTVAASPIPEPSTFALLLGGLGIGLLVRRRKALAAALVLFLALNTARLSNAQNTGSVLDYTTSWVGNSFGGGNPTPDSLLKHVPIDIDGIYVTPDGKVYTNTTWDEGGRALTTFANGDIINPVNSNNENNGGADNAGGVALAADNKYVFEGILTGSGVNIKNVSDHSSTGLQLQGSSTVNQSAAILGMTLSKGKLYVTENDVNKVEVFDTATLQLTQSFTADTPARVAVDSSGSIWISHTNQTVLPFDDEFAHFGTNIIDRYDSAGHRLSSLTVPDDADVTALWIDAHDRLFVGDNGVDQNVKVYAHILIAPVLETSFGGKNGIYEGSDPGLRAPLRFHGITGVGTDSFGHIYVAQNGYGPTGILRGSNGHGAYLESYTLGGKLVWSLNGLEFVTMGGFDPQDETEFYDAYHRFKVDYSQPPGQEAKHVADTENPVRYPRDIRLTKGSGATAQIQYLQGRKFLFVTSQAGGFLAIFRFDPSQGEVAIPCAGLDYGAFQMKYNDWDYQPMNGEFIWRDLNGDGATQPNEFLQPPNTRHVDGQVWWPDTNGDIWQIAYYSDLESSIHFRRYRFQGFDRLGAPIYDYGHVDHYDVPAPLTDVDKLAFYPNLTQGGTLFLGGSANGTGAFTKVARFDHWDSGNRKPSWVTELPWTPDPNNTWAPNSFAVTGDYLFADYWVPHYVEVYSATTGAYVGRIQPGDNVGGPPNAGNTDVPQSIEAFRRPNGEYEISQEEDYQAKILLYRWTPSSTPFYTRPSAPSGLSSSTAGVLTTLSWNPVPNALHYTLYRSDSRGGPFSLLANGITQANVNLPGAGLKIGNTYYYEISAATEIGSSRRSESFAVVATEQGSIFPAVNASYTSPSFFVNCPACFAGGRVGDVAPGVTITFNDVTVNTAGTYQLELWYVNGNNPWSSTEQSPAIDYSINGSSPQSTPLPFTGDWNTPGYVNVSVTLQKGSNTVVLSVPANASGGTADIDGLVIPTKPSS